VNNKNSLPEVDVSEGGVFAIPYTIVEVGSQGFLWERDDTKKSNRKIYRTREKAERAAKAHFMQQRR